MMDSFAATPQPPPTGEGKIVTDLVIADLEARRQFGVRKYGTPLRTHNGRDSLVDAYQEALDLCVYLRQRIEEEMDVEATVKEVDLYADGSGVIRLQTSTGGPLTMAFKTAPVIVEGLEGKNVVLIPGVAITLSGVAVAVVLPTHDKNASLLAWKPEEVIRRALAA